MVVGRIIGWLVLFLAIIAEGSDLWGWYDTGRYAVATLGEIWGRIDRESLLALSALLQRPGGGWGSVPIMLLSLPGAPTLAILGLLIIGAFRRRNRRRR